MATPTDQKASPQQKPATTATLVLAFASVYFFWGSTYTAIRIGAAEMPALLLAGTRFLIAGAILLEAVQQDRASAKPTGIAKWWEAKLATLDRPQDQRLFGTPVEQGHPAERSGA